MTDWQTQANEIAELTDSQLGAVTGGSEARAEAQICQALCSMVSEVLKNFAAAMQTAARG